MKQPSYNKFDWREQNPYESWDQFLVRKLREYYESKC